MTMKHFLFFCIDFPRFIFWCFVGALFLGGLLLLGAWFNRNEPHNLRSNYYPPLS